MKNSKTIITVFLFVLAFCFIFLPFFRESKDLSWSDYIGLNYLSLLIESIVIAAVAVLFGYLSDRLFGKK